MKINPIAGLWGQLEKNSALKTVLLVAFGLVFLKKWEPGGNLDHVWYAAIARNMVETGDFFHFFISRYWFDSVFDHMPLTYWITAGLFKLFGVSDFVARLYPMICAFLTYLVVYKIGEEIKSRRFGVLAVLSFALCIMATKWNSSIKMEVPLTLSFVLCFLVYLKSRKDPRQILWLAPLLTWAVWTKGPVAGALPLGFVIWSVAERDFFLFRQKYFYLMAGLGLLLLSIAYVPALRFDGVDVYTRFFQYKKNYLETGSSSFGGPLFYFGEILEFEPHMVLLFLGSLPFLFFRNQLFSLEARKALRLSLVIFLAVVVPFSFFQTKFHHYLRPAYPFLGLASAPALEWLSEKWVKNEERFYFGLRLILLVLIFVAVSFPLRFSGSRGKEVMHIVNILKFDPEIKDKRVYFLGGYYDDPNVIQTFKFYGGMDLAPLEKEGLGKISLEKSYIVAPQNKKADLGAALPGKSCLIENELYCVMTGGQLHLKLPMNVWLEDDYRF